MCIKDPQLGKEGQEQWRYPISEHPRECGVEPLSADVLWPLHGARLHPEQPGVCSSDNWVSVCWVLWRLTLSGLQVEAPEAMPPPPVTGGLIHLPPLCPTHQAQPLKGKLTSPAMEHTKVWERERTTLFSSNFTHPLPNWHLYSPGPAPSPFSPPFLHFF